MESCCCKSFLELCYSSHLEFQEFWRMDLDFIWVGNIQIMKKGLK